MCEAVLDGRVGPALEEALTHWAGARASAGIGLDETLSDLAALHTAVSGALGELGPRRRLSLPGTDGSRLVRVVRWDGPTSRAGTSPRPPRSTRSPDSPAPAT